MPYGDLRKQIWQRFASYKDLDKYNCTIEEREEYESHLQRGNILYAGVDYGDILERAEQEAEIILWDGGNNDIPFYRPDLHIVLADSHRPGHEVRYYPGETNLRMANVVMITKVGNADPAWIAEVTANVQAVNPRAVLLKADSEVSVPDGRAIRGKRVLVVEDGPTLTHGGMTYGAAHVAAQRFGASQIVDPRPFAVGSIRQTFEKYPHLKDVLPAMGYGEHQVRDLRATIEAVPCDLVLVGTPLDLGRLIRTNRQMMRVTYSLDAAATQELSGIVDNFLKSAEKGRRAHEKGLSHHPKPVN